MKSGEIIIRSCGNLENQRTTHNEKIVLDDIFLKVW